MARHSYSVTWTEICAFWGMVVAAFTHFFGGMFHALVRLFFSDSKAASLLTNIANICQLLGNVALLIAIALPAYQFVKYKTKGWRIFYWVSLILFILGVVFGIAII